MQKIPKIIHQIWSGISEPLPECLKVLTETWKEQYPEWNYLLWDNDMMNNFVRKNYPQYWNIYNKYPYNVQRWDSIRYLILNKMGGMYVDSDYESIHPMDQLLKDKTCCFAIEPELHRKVFPRDVEEVFNNALMASIPEHPFMCKIISTVFTEAILEYQGPKDLCVFNTTGPWILIDLYRELTEKEKEDIYLIPAKYVTPFDLPQSHRLIAGEISEELENCLKEAYAVHYFLGSWRKGNC